MDPSSGWREVARDEGLLTYVLIKVVIELYVASRRVRINSIVKIENISHSSTIHVTMGLPPQHMINPRPTRFVPGKAIECIGRPRRYGVDPLSGWREVARVDALINEVL